MSLIVTIGPKSELHVGRHGDLLLRPPEGVAYRVVEALHTMFWPVVGGRLGEDVDLAECVTFGPMVTPVHSERWPVLGCRGWICSCDDFSYSIIAGRSLESERRRLVGGVNSVPRYECRVEGELAVRAQIMARAFAHPSCKALVVPCELAKQRLERLLSGAVDPRVISALLAKTRVIYSGVDCLDRMRHEAKWSTDQITLVFCGRKFIAKRGDVAVEAMRQVVDKHVACNAVIVRDDPELVKGGETSRLRVYSQVQRPDMIDILARSHILVHPSKWEMPGNVYIEAMANGMAIVAGREDRAAAGNELLNDDGATWVSSTDYDDAVKEAVLALDALVSDRVRARAMADANRAQCEDGVLSASVRRRSMAQLYEQCAASDSNPLLAPEVISSRQAVVEEIATGEVLQRMREHRRSHGRDSGYFEFVVR